jgi:hypothetical protein
MRSAYATATGAHRIISHHFCTCRSASFVPMDGQFEVACQRRVVVGTEPEFTNFAKRAFSNGEEFCETLDYIWLSDEWQVGDVIPLPLRKEVPPEVESFPSGSEPSDHMLIGAQLSLHPGA